MENVRFPESYYSVETRQWLGHILDRMEYLM